MRRPLKENVEDDDDDDGEPMVGLLSSAKSEVAALGKQRSRRSIVPSFKHRRSSAMRDAAQHQFFEELQAESNALLAKLQESQAENETLKTQVAQLEAEVQQLEEINDTGRGKDEQPLTGAAFWKGKVGELMQQQREDKEGIENKEKSWKDKLAQVMQDGSTKLLKAQAEIQRLTDEVEKLRGQQQEQEAAAAAWTREKQELMEQNISTQQTADMYRQEVESLHEQLMSFAPPMTLAPTRSEASVMSLGHSLGGQMSAIDADELYELQEQVDDLIQERDQLVTAQEETEEAKQLLEKEHAELRSEVKQLRTSQSENTQLKNQLEQLTTAEAAWEKEKEQLQSELKGGSDLQQRIEELRRERDELLTCQQEAKDARKLSDKLKQELEHARELIDKLTQERDQLAVSQKETVEAKSSLENEKARLNTELTKLKVRSLESLKVHRAENTDEQTDASSRVAELQLRITELELDLAQAQKSLAKWEEAAAEGSWSSLFSSFMCARQER